ncbi:hypothetical protein [Haloarchaeobius sp. HRN-SO-5]|uniref:hypothetical protein n=1 Tax=Haloarchaeobius sp. HRN-SO-5 TaxID=3446118 RepID=UPI003EB6DE50
MRCDGPIDVDVPVDDEVTETTLAEDATVAAVSLAIVVAIGFAAQVDVYTPLVVVSFLGSILLEVALTRWETTVRDVWGRQWVRPLAVTLLVAVALVGAFVAPSLVFAVLWGGLAGYLLLAALVLGGVLSVSSE